MLLCLKNSYYVTLSKKKLLLCLKKSVALSFFRKKFLGFIYFLYLCSGENRLLRYHCQTAFNNN